MRVGRSTRGGGGAVDEKREKELNRNRDGSEEGERVLSVPRGKQSNR